MRGTIKPGETADVAALREACEETGLAALRLVRKVGEYTYDMAPYRFETQHRHVFHLEVDEPTLERWVSLEKDPDDGSGQTFRVLLDPFDPGSRSVIRARRTPRRSVTAPASKRFS